MNMMDKRVDEVIKEIVKVNDLTINAKTLTIWALITFKKLREEYPDHYDRMLNELINKTKGII